ncbi:hypothetical protein MES4922_170160 [Mesorhizobium ventifaucium]|uniref:Uncharacterized protein n=1 Tax=Mesorhizobium ventifaucium TaxID=666020 RepID=A0ABM9DL28_9HYPH|nr:hypothetical protein MES4922_170160 [Mesorhizobium ventifaucium]
MGQAWHLAASEVLDPPNSFQIADTQIADTQMADTGRTTLKSRCREAATTLSDPRRDDTSRHENVWPNYPFHRAFRGTLHDWRPGRTIAGRRLRHRPR